LPGRTVYVRSSKQRDCLSTFLTDGGRFGPHGGVGCGPRAGWPPAWAVAGVDEPGVCANATSSATELSVRAIDAIAVNPKREAMNPPRYSCRQLCRRPAWTGSL